ncbi:hypothetical protein [Abyssogena phaseoliformis symbiont]|nr:hypothetical protein [Abyssogena phaseoliformis symbiont]
MVEKERKNINGTVLIRYQTPPLKNQGAIYGKLAAQVFLNKKRNY